MAHRVHTATSGGLGDDTLDASIATGHQAAACCTVRISILYLDRTRLFSPGDLCGPCKDLESWIISYFQLAVQQNFDIADSQVPEKVILT
jgi:hypothetical protein